LELKRQLENIQYTDDQSIFLKDLLKRRVHVLYLKKIDLYTEIADLLKFKTKDFSFFKDPTFFKELDA